MWYDRIFKKNAIQTKGLFKLCVLYLLNFSLLTLLNYVEERAWNQCTDEIF